MMFTGPKKEGEKKQKQEENKAKNPSTPLNYHFPVTTSLFWPYERWHVIPPHFHRREERGPLKPDQHESYHKAQKTAPRMYRKFCSPLAAQTTNSDYRLGGIVTQVQLQLTGPQVSNTAPPCNTHQFDHSQTGNSSGQSFCLPRHSAKCLVHLLCCVKNSLG